jgi:hypothetical protein
MAIAGAIAPIPIASAVAINFTASVCIFLSPPSKLKILLMSFAYG